MDVTFREETFCGENVLLGNVLWKTFRAENVLLGNVVRAPIFQIKSDFLIPISLQP